MVTPAATSPLDTIGVLGYKALAVHHLRSAFRYPLFHFTEVVIAGLKPEYDAVHFVMTVSAGCEQIPLLLKGEPAPSDSELGSKDYSKVPVAIITGGTFDAEGVAQMMAATAATPGTKSVPWLRPDPSKPAPPRPHGPERAKALVVRIKEVLKTLGESGQMDEAKVVFY